MTSYKKLLKYANSTNDIKDASNDDFTSFLKEIQYKF